MAEDDKKAAAVPAKTVTLFNRGIRIFRLPGGKIVNPGQTVEIDEALDIFSDGGCVVEPAPRRIVLLRVHARSTLRNEPAAEILGEVR